MGQVVANLLENAIKFCRPGDRVVIRSIAGEYSGFEVDTIDGVKIYFDQEWVHLRKSNTEPIIRIYSESENNEKAQQLAARIIEEIKSLI